MHVRTLFAPLLAGLALGLVSCNGVRHTDIANKDAAPPRLAVLVVFDQMRGDYPIRWMPLFGKGGFARVADEGAWFQNCYYPYGGTWTAPGHASVAAGCPPRVHGVISNEWYSFDEAKEVTSVLSDRVHLVPPLPASENLKKDKKDDPAAPVRLLAPTLGDVVTKAGGKVVCLSLKDRSAVLPAGQSRDAAVYWADSFGRAVTSSYYRERVHDWVRAFNEAKRVDSYLDTSWHRFRPEIDYVRWAGFDDAPGEGKGSNQGAAFPHPFVPGKGGMRDYYTAVANSPAGNELLFDLAKRAIDGEKLGSRATPDFLSISFSSNDLIGHTWGPNSQEVLDITLRSDAMLRELMAYLDEKVGKGRWVLALTADHGIVPLPEYVRTRGAEGRRIDDKKFLAAAEKFLDSLFVPKPGQKDNKGKWIERHVSNMLYLNRKRIANRGVKPDEVHRALAVWAAEQPGIQAAFTRRELQTTPPGDDDFGWLLRRSFFDARSGDLLLILKPGCLMTSSLTGTTHGSPHDLDRHVPLMVIGPGVVAGIRKEQAVSPEQTAVILAQALKLDAPAKATVEVPKGLFAEPK